MAYTSLKASEFGKRLVYDMERYKETIFPTGIDCLEHYLCVIGNGSEWSNGILEDARTIKNIDRSYKRNDTREVADIPEDNPIFDLIPDIPQDQFLGYGFYTSENPEENTKGRTICHLSDNSMAAEMPFNVDVHYLSACMMFIKHISLNPDRLNERLNDISDQKELVSEILLTGMEIIKKRGIEEDFAKSCSELEKLVPKLTHISEEYLNQEKERHEEIKRSEALAESMTPEERERMKKIRDESMDRLLSSEQERKNKSKKGLDKPELR